MLQTASKLTKRSVRKSAPVQKSAGLMAAKFTGASSFSKSNSLASTVTKGFSSQKPCSYSATMAITPKASPVQAVHFYKNNNNNNLIKKNHRLTPAAVPTSIQKSGFHSKVMHRSRPELSRPGLKTIQKTSLFSHRTNEATHNHLKSQNQSQTRSFADYPPHQAEPLPALSPTMETGNLDQWLKKEGDHIKAGDAIASVQTDKATIDWQVTDEGYLAKILVPEGTENIPVGGPPLCIIVEDKEDIAAFKDYKPESSGSSSKQESSPKKEETPAPKKEEKPSEPQQSEKRESVPEGSPVVAGSPPPANELKPERILASPLAKSLAAQLGVDLSSISGSGPSGRIVAADLSKGSAQKQTSDKPQAKKASTPSAAPSSGASYTDIQNSNIRKTTARRLTESKQTIPHYYLTVECQVDELLKTRAYLNGKANGKYKISVNDFVLKAASLALKDVPECNSHWMDSFIRQYNNIDINVAVNTDKGLFIPVVRNVDKLGLAQISEGVKVGAEKARNGTITPQEMEGTFTISNLGMFGITNFSAVINPPQSCILAVSSSVNRVVEDGQGGYKNSSFMNVTLSCDHRVVDGAIGARWLQSFKGYVEDPLKMLV